MNKVTRPQISATYGLATGAPKTFRTLPFERSPTALPAKDKPITATVGPITAAGITLSIQEVPAYLTIRAIATYTRPAKIAPIIIPIYPTEADTAPPKAAHIEPINAKDEPKNTGLLNLVNKR